MLNSVTSGNFSMERLASLVVAILNTISTQPSLCPFGYLLQYMHQWMEYLNLHVTCPRVSELYLTLADKETPKYVKNEMMMWTMLLGGQVHVDEVNERSEKWQLIAYIRQHPHTPLTDLLKPVSDFHPDLGMHLFPSARQVR